MIKISDCNNCDNRGCGIYHSIRFECKLHKPPQAQKLSWLGQVALASNPQGLYDTLKECRLKLLG